MTLVCKRLFFFSFYHQQTKRKANVFRHVLWFPFSDWKQEAWSKQGSNIFFIDNESPFNETIICIRYMLYIISNKAIKGGLISSSTFFYGV